VMNLDPKTMMNSTFLKVTPKSGKIENFTDSKTFKSHIHNN